MKVKTKTFERLKFHNSKRKKINYFNFKFKKISIKKINKNNIF